MCLCVWEREWMTINPLSMLYNATLKPWTQHQNTYRRKEKSSDWCPSFTACCCVLGSKLAFAPTASISYHVCFFSSQRNLFGFRLFGLAMQCNAMFAMTPAPSHHSFVRKLHWGLGLRVLGVPNSFTLQSTKCSYFGVSRDWEPVTITIQALSLVEKADPVQVHFTQYLRDQWSMWMQDGCEVHMDCYMASNGSCFMVTWTVFKNTSWK